jgi:hypothetical protein
VSGKAETIAPDAYPQMLDAAGSARLARTLRSRAARTEAAHVITAAAPRLREAALDCVAELEKAGADIAQVSDKAHEIKGFADTAGLPATARLAEGLCHYLERSRELGGPADASLVALHVRAIARAARDGDPGPAAAVVAAELAALTARKLESR